VCIDVKSDVSLIIFHGANIPGELLKQPRYLLRLCNKNASLSETSYVNGSI
jgi:hypothetical protein